MTRRQNPTQQPSTTDLATSGPKPRRARRRFVPVAQWSRGAKAAGVLTGTFLGAGISALTGQQPTVGSTIGFIVSVLLAAFLTNRNTGVLTAALIAYVPVSFFAGNLFLLVGEAGRPIPFPVINLIGGPAFLYAAALITTALAMKFSRSPSSVTVVIALTASVIGAYAVVLLVPALGLWASFIMMGITVLLGSRFFSWMRGLTTIAAHHAQDLTATARHTTKTAAVKTIAPVRPSPTPATPTLVTVEQQHQLMEAVTARLLSSLTTATCFHNYRVPNHPEPLPHLVVAPSGMFMIVTAPQNHPLISDNAFGARIPGFPLNTAIQTLLAQREAIAHTLRTVTVTIGRKLSPEDITLLLILPGPTPVAQAHSAGSILAIFRPGDNTNEPSTHAIVTSSKTLNETIKTQGNTPLEQGTQRAILNLLRMRRTDAPKSLTAATHPSPTPDLDLVLVGSDNRVTRPSGFEDTLLSWMKPNAPAEITISGVPAKIRILRNPYLSSLGVVTTEITSEAAWWEAKTSTFPAAGAPVDVESIMWVGQPH